MSKSGSKEKKIPNKRLLALSISLSVIIIFGVVTYKMLFPNQESKFSLKAAIVDQLSEHFLNSAFNVTVTNLLDGAGFNVSYFSSEKITVEQYKEIVEGDYGIIIFRAHSALREDGTAVDFFTSEEFDENKYYDYLMDGLLSIAEYRVPLGNSSGKFYFAITPNFIEHLGHFPHSIIIAMGCSSLNVTGMAQTFIAKGAKAYIGWTEVVLPNDTDRETTKFLEMFLGENKTLGSSIAVTIPYDYYDPNQQKTVTTRVDFYPVQSSVRDLRISDLIAEARDSKNSMTFSNSETLSFIIALFSLNQKTSLQVRLSYLLIDGSVLKLSYKADFAVDHPINWFSALC
jgi:hypothetical protein